MTALTDFEAMIAGIRAEPNDPVKRLVLADYIEEVIGPFADCPECSRPCRRCGGRVNGRTASNSRGKTIPLCRTCWRADRKSLSRHHGWRWGKCRACDGECRTPTYNAERAAFIRAAVRHGDGNAMKELHAMTCQVGFLYTPSKAFELDSSWVMEFLYSSFAGRKSRYYKTALTIGGFVGEVATSWRDWPDAYKQLMASPWAVLRRVWLQTWPAPAMTHVSADSPARTMWGPDDEPTVYPDMVGCSTDELLRRALGDRFPGHCPNHPIVWAFPWERDR